MGGTKIKVGGGDGISHYTVYQGKASSINATGWEMKIKIYEDGSVKGSNTNERIKSKKEYNGTFRNGVLNVVVDFSDGRQVSYNGSLTLKNGAPIKLGFTVIKGGMGSIPGDKGYNTGTLKIEE